MLSQQLSIKKQGKRKSREGALADRKEFFQKKRLFTCIHRECQFKDYTVTTFCCLRLHLYFVYLHIQTCFFIVFLFICIIFKVIIIILDKDRQSYYNFNQKKTLKIKILWKAMLIQYVFSPVNYQKQFTGTIMYSYQCLFLKIWLRFS